MERPQSESFGIRLNSYMFDRLESRHATAGTATMIDLWARANDCDPCRFLGIAAERHASMRRLRRNIIEPWTAYAAGITFCARTESTDIASELASGIRSIHRAADFSLWHWTAPW